jgi:signal transduction histidine kinase
MQSKRLAQWLLDHTEMLGTTEDAQDATFHEALYEGIIDVALSGETRLADSVTESVAAHAVATGRKLTSLLGVHQRLRQRIWDRIGEEIDPEPAFAMLTAVDAIFSHIIRLTIDSYQTANQLAQAAKSTEISRLYTESEQKVMEYATEVARANRELARLEQAKTDFINIAAHELKTPLTLIQGYVNILLEQNLNDQGQSLTAGIERGVQRINSILEDMLDLSALEMGRVKLVLQPIHLNRTINLVVRQLEQTLTDRQLTLVTRNLDKLPVIEADSTRLHQIFKQLIGNAIKYTPDGGQIMISGRNSSTTNDVTITVQDTGVGIAPEDREKIFETFFRASDSAHHSTGQTKFMGAGPGLGLAIVKGLVEAHGGQVKAESPGFDLQNCPGSKFTVVLPTEAAPPPNITIQRIASTASLEILEDTRS